MSLKITGLSRKQIAMLDIMWSMQDIEEVQAWQSSLSPSDQAMACALMNMILLELIDEVTINDFSQANEILAKFRL